MQACGTFTRPLSLITLGMCVAFVFVVGATQTREHFDDAYITYRYAHNLSAGIGFVYNAGENVLGTTTPLYGLLLAGFAIAGADIPTASHWLSVIGWAASVTLVYRIGRATQDEIHGLIAAALVAVCPLFMQVIGMETNLTIAFSLAAFERYLARRTVAAFALAALATWMRLDSMLVAIVLGSAYLWQWRKLPMRESTVFIGITTPWLLFAQWTYGSVVPNSVFAKAGQGLNAALGGSEIGSFGWGLVRVAHEMVAAQPLYALIGLCALIGLADALRRRPRWLIVVTWIALYVVAYIALGVLYFPWYYPPLWPTVALLCAAGIRASAQLRWGVSAKATTPSFSKMTANRYVISIALSITVLIAPLAQLQQTRTASVSPYYQGYTAIADWLRANTPPNTSVGLIEIGIIGYQSERRVVDSMGLVTPGMVGHLHDWAQVWTYAVARYWPDVVVALDGTAAEGVARTTWFTDAYTPVANFPSMGIGSRAATVYRRTLPSPAFASARVVGLNDGDATVTLTTMRMTNALIHAGDVSQLQLDWQSLRHTDASYLVLADLVNARDGRRWPLAKSKPQYGGNPTNQWQPNEIIQDTKVVRWPRGLSDGAYLIEVKLADETNNRGLRFANHDGRTIPHVALGPLWVGAPNDALPIANASPARFGDTIELLGYDWTRSESLTLYWRTREPLYDDYIVFAHVYDPTGRLVAQHDGAPVGGKLPTSLWLPNITVPDTHPIVLPANLPSGTYTLRVGMYRFESGERLPVSAPADRVVERAYQLTQFVR